MSEDVRKQDDWQFQQATGIAAAQIGTGDLTEAAGRLVTAASEVGESVHDTALMVLEGRLRLASPGRTASPRRSLRFRSGGKT